jgi:hypothetical protein
MIRIDLEVYYDSYKDIVVKSLDVGVPLPFVLERINVPLEYRFSGSEWDSLNEEYSSVFEGFRDFYSRRRLESNQLFFKYSDGDVDSRRKVLEDYFDDEFYKWLDIVDGFGFIVID